jgi:hypothetical protein
MTEISTKESPFSPGRPVQPEYFVARKREIQRLERAIRQTVSGRNENTFIAGQRGVGKSSLAGFIRFIAEKEYGLVGTHCHLGGITSLEYMMGEIFQRLLQDCTDKSLFEKLKEGFSNYIKGVTLFGVEIEFTKDKEKLQTLVSNFLPILRKIYEDVKDSGKKGLLIILDDLNGLADAPQFSPFLKSFIDELATSRKTLPIFLVLVGSEERRVELIKHQPSVARIFDVIDLPIMSNSESEDFFKKMFGKQGVNITSEALSLMVQLSGGLPMLMHEVGDAVFWHDTDNKITENDARAGIMEAAEIVGRRYINQQVTGVLRNRTYSSILKTIARKLPVGTTFTRGEILNKLQEKERKNLDNFLQKTKGFGIIVEGEMRAEYKFVNPLYHLFVWLLYKEQN